MHKNHHDALADVLKGIGIISVVIGHSGVLFSFLDNNFVTKFVYMYHLMIFFFTSGMLYRPEKHPDPYVYIGKQLKSTVPLFVGYNFFFLLLHNVFSRHTMLELSPYSRNDFIIQGLSIFALKHIEMLAGALWFIPMFLFAKAFFAIGFQSAERFRSKQLVHTGVIFISATAGLYTASCGMNLHFNIQTALLAVPVLYLGYLFNRYRGTLSRFINPLTGIISAGIMVGIILLKIGHIDLANNQIISPVLFYPITLLGIIFCVSLAEIIRRSKLCTTVISYIGSVSFHIMALHFFVFKCFDWGYRLLFEIDPHAAARFPTALDNIGWIYSLLGISIPTLFIFFIRKITVYLKR